jgi:hypothetical protein
MQWRVQAFLSAETLARLRAYQQAAGCTEGAAVTALVEWALARRRTCPVCGTPLGANPRQAYCSATCRTRGSRQRVRPSR